jgi:hypothetical protein
MAGDPKTNSFLLTQATVMVGAFGSSLDLQPAKHTLGLTKAFRVTRETQTQDLTYGLKNIMVDSVTTGETISGSFEAYEFNARTLNTSLGLLPADISTTPGTASKDLLNANIAAAATTAVVIGDVTTKYSVGDWIQIVQGDTVHPAKLTAVATASGNTTLTFAGRAVPAGTTFDSALAHVQKSTILSVGTDEEMPYLSMKATGTMAGDGKQLTIVFPKIKITKGFEIAMNNDNYANLPIEFNAFSILSADAEFSKFPKMGSMFPLVPSLN